ncbi:hypothetical protein NKJ09_23255 [Mesorhizobium sp. M0189]|uniref:hypothetical protein n=1 Tax=Mesorhizobium sp. M0189 TaxID=2956909 RepID=UPI0033370DAD
MANSFVDLLRETPNERLDASMRFAKLLCLRDRPDSRHTKELREEFKGSPIDIDACPRMVHFRVGDDVVALADTITVEQLGAAHQLFRPIADLYSFEYFGFCAFVFATVSPPVIAVAGGSPDDGTPIWAFEYKLNGEGLKKVEWEFNSCLSDLPAEDRKYMAENCLCVLAAVNAIITIPGLCLVSATVPSAADRAERKKDSLPALIETVDYTLHRPKGASEGVEGYEGGSPTDRPLHHVIGHFRLLQKGRQSPLLAFVSPHWRGRAENGVVLKNYDICKSEHPFSPPLLSVEPNSSPE